MGKSKRLPEILSMRSRQRSDNSGLARSQNLYIKAISSLLASISNLKREKRSL
ncbi:hypothetical protein [Nostoc sp. 'Lobaria pulmonaria (5183) cyanobiont']|uniref:hypothetical protein n=1 Tax=Nostoc sp. 'Lobaria pulmonaria (5183) cyanobiont' TaxID=1618022 RepID=UPI00131A21C2|nr:hypothetical protein [Nostoc sp. 'Lobaria pulmonaria (5183) cyanobiont']